MIHYNVWFNINPAVPEENGLRAVSRFLKQLCQDGEAGTFKLLRNMGNAPRSKLSKFHALVEFSDAEQLAAAMKLQTERGIFAGLHGAVVEAVVDFHVEIFTVFQKAGDAALMGEHACEI